VLYTCKKKIIINTPRELREIAVTTNNKYVIQIKDYKVISGINMGFIIERGD